jgi:hypothetical protein
VRVRIDDQRALRGVTPAALAGYVRAEGWSRVRKFGDHSDVYARADAPEVILPATEALGDYPQAVAALISALAKHEERDELQVYRDLTVADRDVIRVRAPDADDDGSVEIDVGVEIVHHARDLLLSAACSAYDPRPSYRAGSIKEATEYMSRVRLGQTEQGSFVVALLAPVPPELTTNQPMLWPDLEDEPFDRLVTRRLVSGLLAARSAAEEAI